MTERQARVAIVGLTSNESKDAAWVKRRTVEAKKRDPAFGDLVKVAQFFADRASRLYDVAGNGSAEKIALHDRDQNPYGYSNPGFNGSIELVNIRINESGKAENLWYPVVRLGLFDTRESRVHLAIAASDGVLFPIEKKPGYIDYDLSKVSIKTPDGKRYYLVDGIGLAEFDEDCLKEGKKFSLTTGVKIQFDIVKYDRDAAVKALKRTRLELQRLLDSTPQIANSQPVSE